MNKKSLHIGIGFVTLILIIPMLGLLPFSEASFDDTNSYAVSCADVSDLNTRNIITVTDSETGEKSEISVEEYLIGVVSAEMPISFKSEALKAQAVAAHTYALTRYGTEDYEFNDGEIPTDPSVFQAYSSIDDMLEKYGDNFEESYAKIKNAVDSVLNLIITYDDKPIVAAFHSMSGGTTQSSESVWGGSLPYLIPVDSSFDESQSNYISEKFTDTNTAQNILLSAYPDITLPESHYDWFNITSRTTSDYVDTVSVGDKSLTGSQMRSLFNLNSSDFTIECREDGFLFTVKGKGHGVGMSQYGANEMAKSGKSFEEILLHYYPGTQLTTIK